MCQYDGDGPLQRNPRRSDLRTAAHLGRRSATVTRALVLGRRQLELEAHPVPGLEVDLLEPGHLLAAGAAPGRPHVEHQRPPAKVAGQVERGPAGEPGHLEM